MISTCDFLKQEALSHLNSFSGIICHLEDTYKATGDEDARRVLESLGFSLQSLQIPTLPATGKNVNNENAQTTLKGSPELNPELNYYAPEVRLQELLAGAWFDEVSVDKKKYSLTWRNSLITALMASEYRNEIAKEWANESLRLKIRGYIMGALAAASVFTKKALAIARIYYGTRENTKEVKTLAKYMGDGRRKYYTDWIIEYVMRTK